MPERDRVVRKDNEETAMTDGEDSGASSPEPADEKKVNVDTKNITDIKDINDNKGRSDSYLVDGDEPATDNDATPVRIGQRDNVTSSFRDINNIVSPTPLGTAGQKDMDSSSADLDGRENECKDLIRPSASEDALSLLPNAEPCLDSESTDRSGERSSSTSRSSSLEDDVLHVKHNEVTPFPLSVFNCGRASLLALLFATKNAATLDVLTKGLASPLDVLAGENILVAFSTSLICNLFVGHKINHHQYHGVYANFNKILHHLNAEGIDHCSFPIAPVLYGLIHALITTQLLIFGVDFHLALIQQLEEATPVWMSGFVHLMKTREAQAVVALLRADMLAIGVENLLYGAMSMRFSEQPVNTSVAQSFCLSRQDILSLSAGALVMAYSFLVALPLSQKINAEGVGILHIPFLSQFDIIGPCCKNLVSAFFVVSACYIPLFTRLVKEGAINVTNNIFKEETDKRLIDVKGVILWCVLSSIFATIADAELSGGHNTVPPAAILAFSALPAFLINASDSANTFWGNRLTDASDWIYSQDGSVPKRSQLLVWSAVILALYSSISYPSILLLMVMARYGGELTQVVKDRCGDNRCMLFNSRSSSSLGEPLLDNADSRAGQSSDDAFSVERRDDYDVENQALACDHAARARGGQVSSDGHLGAFHPVEKDQPDGWLVVRPSN